MTKPPKQACTFTPPPILPEGYTLAAGAALPNISMLVDAANVMLLATGITGDFTVTGGTLNTDCSYADSTITILKNTALTVSGVITADK